ncbi:hypothetical protein EDD22DRAFT_767200 [Suillus occidentalis]|nr:hypothetical protein EDD22DRAFT_767200 [Suillus occidentalis]
MPRIRNNPNLNVCPDYAADVFENIRVQLVNENTMEAQAMQLLRNIWEANNNAVKLLWQQQVDEDREQQEHRERLDEDEQERLNQEKIDEEEAASKEEKKKNKHKYLPILGTGIPNKPSITPYEANTKKTIDDDAMILSMLADGLTGWVSSTSTRNAHSVVNDENLPFEEFCQACPHFLTVIEEADWPQDRVQMMARFWMNIQVHKYRSLRDPIAHKTLLTYQSEQRKRWHIAAKSSVGLYDISKDNEKVLQDTREKVYWEEHNKRDNACDYKVSI